ncbi:MAG: PSD1 and planctomycete cytochrome C domain-containing protein [Pirellulales bacterium]|nr:PSD1 and planctomycete cytochrome C domain-containing protein [Pirellulales bacterium]
MRPLATLCSVLAVFAATHVSAAEPNSAGVRFFENKIRPVLVRHCYKCHSADADEIEGGLLLDSREATHEGGDRGAAVVPRNLDDSLLIEAIRYEDEDFQMPPKAKLPDSVIADFERWIKMGAPDPRKAGKLVRAPSKINIEEGRKFWAYQPVENADPPVVRDREWTRDPIDHFILTELEQKNLKPADDASRDAWLRRVTYDLVGLPPTVAELDAFAADKSPEAKAKVVDRLLASPQFGERWGRHWLDIARYGESTGRTRNYPYTHAWRYRDYVIDAVNNDKPYDEFITEQLAGDLLAAKNDAERHEHLIATGFLALASLDLNERDQDIFFMEVVNDQIDVTSRAMMGLTVACARCHDHKFDPIPTANYYALAGIFRSSTLLAGYGSRQGGGNRVNRSLFHSLGKPDAKAVAEAKKKRAKDSPEAKKRLLEEKYNEQRALIARLKKTEKRILANRDPKDKGQARELADIRKKFALARTEVRDLRKELGGKAAKKKYKKSQPVPTGPLAMGVRESNNVADCRVHLRGDTKNLGDAVPRGFLEVVSLADELKIGESESGRLQLAKWLTSPEHPLTSRVMVNRIWHHLFGRGLVRTVDNFGEMGARPSHPELLDHLAARFVQDGWSVKRLIRTIVLSRTYGLSGDYSEKNYAVDPDNVYLWRANHRRLQVEAIRDAMLAIRDELNRDRPQGAPVQQLPIAEVGRNVSSLRGAGQVRMHRTVYQPVVRNFVPDMFVTFDFAEPSEVRGAREITTVAPQALFMMNSEFVRARSEAAAKKLVETTGMSDADRVDIVYRQTVGRLPTDGQRRRLLEHVKKRLDENKSKTAQADAWASVYHALFASAEFRYVH